MMVMVTMVDGFWMQALAVMTGLFAIWIAQSLSKRIFGASRSRGRKKSLASRHFIKGAQLLARSRSLSISARNASNNPEARSLAKEANREADLAISMDPLDAASYVLKALALDQQGLGHEALRSMDIALSPEIAPSLSPSELADALIKRGDLLLATFKGGGGRKKLLAAAISDFERSLQISPDNPKVLCMLGMAQEKSRMFANAESSYERALGLDPELDDARAGLLRLRP